MMQVDTKERADAAAEAAEAGGAGGRLAVQAEASKAAAALAKVLLGRRENKACSARQAERLAPGNAE